MWKSSSLPWFALLACLAAMCLTLAGERIRGIAFNTTVLAIATVAIAVPVGTLVAFVLAKTDAYARRWMLAAFAVLLFVPMYLQVAGWQAALGVGGWMTHDPATGLADPWLDGWRAAIWIHAAAAVPWVVLIVAAALARVPAETEEAASLVASPWRVLGFVTLPAVWPAIAVAAVWIMVSVAAEMTVTDFFQIRTFAEEVYTTAAAGGFPTDNPKADYAAWMPWARNLGFVAGVGLLVSLAAMALVPVVEYLARAADVAAERAWRWHCGRGRWLAALLPAAVLVVVAAIPIASLVYKAGLGSEQTATGWQRVWSVAKLQSELSAAVGYHARELLQTLTLGAGVAAGAVCVGIIVGWHVRTNRRKSMLTILALSFALSIPGPVLGLLVIDLLNHPNGSILSPLTWAYDRTLLAPWIAQMVRITPVAALVMAAGFAHVPRTLIDTAATDGAGWWQTLLRVVLPMNLAMVAAAGLIAFALSAGELAATVLVMPPGPPTLTLRLFSLLHYGIEDRVAAITLVFLAGVAVVAGSGVWLLGAGRRRQGGVI